MYGGPQSYIQVGDEKLEVVASFCFILYLCDMLSAGSHYNVLM